MARKPKLISVYERIEETKSEITSTEQHLSQLKSQLETLLVEKEELEMRQAWEIIKKNGMTLEEIQKILLTKK